MAANDTSEFDYTPGYSKSAHEYGQPYGDEFHAEAVVELLASMGPYRQRGVTLAGGQGVLPTGCVIGRQTATGKYFVYKSTNSDGTQVALGFLRNARDTGGASSPAGKPSTDCQGNLVYAGALNLAAISGTDTGGLFAGTGGGFGSGTATALGGRVVNWGSGIGAAPFGGSPMDLGNNAVFIF